MFLFNLNHEILSSKITAKLQNGILKVEVQTLTRPFGG